MLRSPKTSPFVFAVALTGITLCASVLSSCNSPAPIASPSPQPTTPQNTPQNPQNIAASSPTPLPTVTITAAPTVTVTATPTSQPPSVSASTKSKSAPPNFCRDLASWVALVETQNFWVSICMENSDNGVYVGVEKQNPKNKIRLGLSQGSRTFFEARNGKTVYILADTPRGKFLTVTEGDKELLREPALQWVENIR